MQVDIYLDNYPETRKLKSKKMARIIHTLPALFIMAVLFTFIPPDPASAQSETGTIVQLRIQSSMIFSESLPTNELLDLTEKLQDVEFVDQIDSIINSRKQGNIEENRLQINASLKFTDFNEYKMWLTDPETDTLIHTLSENSEQFSMNLRIENL